MDALLISPERLANEDFMQNIFEPILGNIGLFVIDEAHCIIDWDTILDQTIKEL